jgi:hypothetical protein
VRIEDKRAVKITLQFCIRPYLSICGAARGTQFNGELESWVYIRGQQGVKSQCQMRCSRVGILPYCGAKSPFRKYMSEKHPRFLLSSLLAPPPHPSPVSLRRYRLYGDKKDSETGYKRMVDIPAVKAEKEVRGLDPKKTIAERCGLLQIFYLTTRPTLLRPLLLWLYKKCNTDASFSVLFSPVHKCAKQSPGSLRP